MTPDKLEILMVGFPKLKQLTLINMGMSHPMDWIDLYDRLLFRLEILSLGGEWCKHRILALDAAGVKAYLSSNSASSVPSRVRDLTISGMDGDLEASMQGQLWLIQHCTSLVRFRWTTRTAANFHGPMHRLAEAFRSGQRWKQLESLVFRGNFFLEDLVVLMEGIVRLTELDLSHSNFDFACWDVLRRKTPHHLQSLRILHLWICHSVTGSVVQDMLTSLPNLEDFKGTSLNDTDILSDDRPSVMA